MDNTPTDIELNGLTITNVQGGSAHFKAVYIIGGNGEPYAANVKVKNCVFRHLGGTGFAYPIQAISSN